MEEGGRVDCLEEGGGGGGVDCLGAWVEVGTLESGVSLQSLQM